MQRYDDIVVGSGISGMTMSLILAMNGHKTLLIERGPAIGGSMRRFYRNGAPFDTGFHFTGGLHCGGIIDEMLNVLGIRDRIEPVFLSRDNANRFIFEADFKHYEVPYGIAELRLRMKDYFPNDVLAIDGYLDKVCQICNNTPSMKLSALLNKFSPLTEDFITCEDALSSMTSNSVLKALFSAFSMCYGVKPGEISFANHCRISYGLYESVARVKNGGDAFIDAFRSAFDKYGVDILCNSRITAMEDIRDNIAGRFILNTGEEIQAGNCIFTIHPKEVLDTLPGNHISRAFRERVTSFEPSAGSFSVFCLLDPGYEEPDFGSNLVTILPCSDFNHMLEPSNRNDSAMVLIKTSEEAGGKIHKMITAIEPSFPDHVETWKDSTVGHRSAAYTEYKMKKTERLVQRIYNVFPEYRGKLEICDSASVLTFRDYLHNHDGSSYGVKQRIGQFNLVGKLPLRNCYAAGQSAVLPGVIGAMISSFVIAPAIIGDQGFADFLKKGLER
jgi:all-trans-retinol 13,14-reductase